MPTEPGDSWFSPKCMQVQPPARYPGGSALDGLGAMTLVTTLNQTPNARTAPGEGGSRRVRRRGLSFVVERETAQTIG